MGQLKAIWIKRANRGKMDPVESVELVAGKGIVGNANQGARRQVTIIEEEVWQAPCERMEEAAPGLRQAMYADWGGGAFAMVVKGGIINVGDDVEFHDPVLL